MHVFHIQYRNTQGTLMRIINAASRRALDLPYVKAEANANSHQATLLLEVNPKQVGQLRRDWYAIVDVTEVQVGVANSEMLNKIDWSAPHPPVSTGESTRSATA
jgi:acetolactate synthase small subunit